MSETDWFEGRGVDDMPRLTILPWLIWATFALAMILSPLLFGCTSVDGICGVKPIGQDENGIAYFAYHCEPK